MRNKILIFILILAFLQGCVKMYPPLMEEAPTPPIEGSAGWTVPGEGDFSTQGTRPDQAPQKDPEGSDAIYTQENGSLSKVRFDSARNYFVSGIKTTQLAYIVDTVGTANPDSIRGYFVQDATAAWFYISPEKKALKFASNSGFGTGSNFLLPNTSATSGQAPVYNGANRLVWGNVVLDTTLNTKVDSLGALISGSSTITFSYLETSTINGNYLIRYLGSAPSVAESNGTVTITQPSNCTIDKFIIHGGTDLLSPSNVLTIEVVQTGVSHSSSELDANYFDIGVIERQSSNNVQLGLNSSGFQVRHKTVSGGTLTTEITGLNGLVNYSIIGN